MDESFCGSPLWSVSESCVQSNETGNGTCSETVPNITPCFQNTILVWVPCGYLILVSPVYIYYLFGLQRKGSTTWLNITKTMFSCLLVILCVVDLIYRIQYNIRGISPWPASILAPVLQIIAMGTTVVLIQLGRLRGVRSTGVLFIYWLLQLCSVLLLVQSHARSVHHQLLLNDLSSPAGGVTVYQLTYASAFAVLVLIQLVLASLVDHFRGIDHHESDPMACPEGSASFLSIITFWWFTKMVILGYRQPLTRADLWLLNPEDTSREVSPPFDKEWRKELNKYFRCLEAADRNKMSVEMKVLGSTSPPTEDTKDIDGGVDEGAVQINIDGDNKHFADEKHVDEKVPLKIDDDDVENRQPSEKSPPTAAAAGVETSVKCKTYDPSLWLAICRTYYKPFIVGAFFKLGHDVLLFVSPLLLKLLIAFVRDQSLSPWRGYVYTFLLFAVAFVQSMMLHQYFHRSMVVGMRIRAALVAAVYKKSLRLSNSARKKSTVGEIVNLMSVDAQRFMELTAYINMIWSAPFQMSVSLYFLWMILGPSVLAGVAVMVLMVPVNSYIAKKSRTYQVVQMKLKDLRIKMMNEVLNGIKVLKLYAWELSFQQKIFDIRNKELIVLRKAAYLNAVASFSWSCAPFLVSLTTFAVYVLSSDENVLDAEKAFVSLSLFNILRFPLSMLPMLIANLVQTSVSVKRLRNFLKNEELDETNVEHSYDKDGDAVIVRDGSFSWDKTDERPTLDNIDIHIKEGSFVGIVGQVGSGKSSLLSAILGETEKLHGTVNVKGSVAYVSQQAWIQNATLRDNVLFGKPLNQTVYDGVIDACALRQDLDILPGKDLTEIGEKGINLSGGQKQRVSLARAVYADTDVYLLDDPLSAVDSHVGRHIFDEVLGKNGLLKNKTRVLVTHGISFLPQVDKIIVMVDGRISEHGTYKELLARGGAFAKFLYTYLENEPSMDEDDLLVISELGATVGDVSLQGSVERHLERMNSAGTTDNMSSGDGAGSGAADHLGSLAPLSASVSPIKTARSMSRNSSVRHKSESESDPLTKKGVDRDNKKLIQDETVEKGSVKLSVFLAYMKSIGPAVSIIIILLYVLNYAASVYANFWLSDWSNDKPVNGTFDPQLRDLRLGVYGALGFAQGLAVFLSSFALAEGALRSSTILHRAILESGLRAPMQFFDSTPIGRVINRFSKDIDVIDSALPRTLHSWFACILGVISTLFVICFSTPLFLAITVPLGVVYYLVQRFYVATSRQLRRLESVSRSPIFSHFGETVQGATTIRAFKQQQRFIQESEHRVDENQLCYYPGIASNRWLAVRLEFVGNCLVMFSALFAVVGRDHLSAGIVGLSISYALNITQTLNWLVRMTSELETNIVAVERIKEYAETPSEADWIVEKCRPADTWPDTGTVDFKDYSTRYRPELSPVLNNITLHVVGGEKIGIVGRTGAGKSSLTLGLFRIIEPSSGAIVIDGVNIAEIGLHDLRSKLTIIPQEPVLFSGTLRLNLDPFDKYSDEEVWRTLELAHLRSFVSTLPDGLQHECSEGGENLSVGQRQLVCLARALLRKTKVLILDEATAAVDLETDDLIQSTIRTQFADCTVLTIAHRINTIMDYNRILVLDGGHTAEFDSPANLLSNKTSIFYQLARDAGLAPD